MPSCWAGFDCRRSRRIDTTRVGFHLLSVNGPAMSLVLLAGGDEGLVWREKTWDKCLQQGGRQETASPMDLMDVSPHKRHSGANKSSS
jgi:hypothetical protein